ncbi:hypothetical protein ACFZAU_21900 [Streptomyces sp. NPDC008238]
MVLVDQREEITSPSTRQVIEDAYGYCMRRVVGEDVDSHALRSRFEELLGPDDFPFEDPENVEPWFIDVVSTADYAVRTWEHPDVSASTCFNALLGAYSIVGGLEDDPDLPATSPLGQMEFDRQIDDMRAIRSGVSVEALIDSGDILAQMYAERFLEYIRHYRG